MRTTGAHWEDAAQAQLLRAGLRLIARNWHCRHGELDLIMRDDDALVFVEVRYRGDAGHGDSAASIGPRKRAKLVHAAQMYLAAHPAMARLPCRFDVIAFDGSAGDGSWLRNAFDAY